MLSKRQKFFNFAARYLQKPMLAFVRPQPLARLVFNMNGHLFYKKPKGLTKSKTSLSHDTTTVPAHRVTIGQLGSTGTLLYIHGGAFVIGSLTGYDHMLGALSQQSGLDGMFIDYRLAPEHPFPAARTDVIAAYSALLASGVAAENIAVVGDSAGGNLALSLLDHLSRNDLPMPGAVAVMSPVTDLRLQNPSLETNQKSDLLVPMSWGARGVHDYLNGQSPDDPRISPVLGQFTGAPPVLIHVDQTEVLYDDSRTMADVLRRDGVDVTLTEKRGLPHVWHLNTGRSPEADQSVAEIAQFLKLHIQGTPAQT